MTGAGLLNHFSMGLEAFMGILDAEGQVLAFSALVRVFTLGQAARLFWQGEVPATEPVLEELVYGKGWLGKVEGVLLPKGCGGGFVDVYYLTPEGGRKLRSIAPSLAPQARPGRPRGALKARIPHELLVAEAYLWLSERCEVYEFWPETELKRRIGQARRMRAGRFLKGLPDEATGDFKALVIERGEVEKEGWVEGEVMVRYDPEQVENKPDGMLWFSRDCLQRDIVEYYKGARVIMLADVREPERSYSGTGKDGPGELGAERCRRLGIEIDGWLTRLMNRVLGGLEAVGGMATTEALALVAGTYRPHVSRALKRLEASGRVSYENAQLIPGRDQGRSMRLYILGERQVRSVWEKIKALIRSRVIVEMGVHGYQFFRWDEARDEMQFKGKTGGGKPAITVVIDEPQSPVEDLAERMLAVQARGSVSVAAVALAVREARLHKILAGKMGKVLVCNVVEGRQNRQRKVSNQAQKSAARRVREGISEQS